jgi:hypothetical protein
VDAVDGEIQFIARCELAAKRPLNCNDLNENMIAAFLIFEEAAAYQIMSELLKVMPIDEADNY